MCFTAGGASGAGLDTSSAPLERTYEIFGATDSAAAAAASAITSPTPASRTLLCQLFFMARCASGELRRRVRLFFRAPQASTYDYPKCNDENPCADEEKTVPTVGKS